MVPMSSSDPPRFSQDQRRTLLAVARASIEEGLKRGHPLHPRPQDFDPLLAAPGAAFVTLERAGRLRGCIGSLEARRPLVLDVSENAFAAAFRDPRFPPLSAGELGDLAIRISVLSPAEPLEFRSESDLLAKLRPGVDGLVLEDGDRRGTFLPSVWESLPEPVLFWQQLKQKAGLPPEHWSDSLKVYRYTTESFAE